MGAILGFASCFFATSKSTLPFMYGFASSRLMPFCQEARVASPFGYQIGSAGFGKSGEMDVT